jgi:hypothetical protein
LFVPQAYRAFLEICIERDLRNFLGGLARLLDPCIVEMAQSLMPKDPLLFSSEVANSVGLRLFHEVVPRDLGLGCRLNGFLWTSTALITGIGVEERQFIMVLADRMKIKVRDMTKPL